jgi:hypothetical protein
MAGWLAPVVVWDWSAAIAFTRCSGAYAAPIRQPVIAYALLAPAMMTTALEQLIGRSRKDALAAVPVVDAAIDLVGDDPDPAVPGPLRDPADLGFGVDRTGRIAGRADDEARDQLVVRVQVLHADLEPPLQRAGHHHRLGACEVHRSGDRRPTPATESDLVPGDRRGRSRR